MKMRMDGRKSLTLVATLGLATLITACGGMKTNPTEQYSDLKTSVPPHEEKTRTQEVLSWVLPPPDLDDQVLNFTEGKTASYTIQTQMLVAGTYKVTAEELPEGAKLEADAKTKGKYVLSWTPEIGTLKDSENGHRTIKAKLTMKILSAPKELSAALKPVSVKTYPLALTLNASDEIPTITTVKVSSGGEVMQGQTATITIEAKDPACPKGRTPRLFQWNEEGGGNDVMIADAAGAVKFGKVVETAQGSFRIEGKLDTSKIEIPAGKGEITARFVIMLRSPSSKNESAETTVDVKVKAKPGAALAAPVADDAKPADEPADQPKDETPALATPDANGGTP